MVKTATDTDKRTKKKPAAGTKRANTKAARSTRAKPKSSGKAIQKNKAAHKVWRIYRYNERFELKDDDRRCRKSALQFTRDFVGIMSGNESVGYIQQLSMLSNGDGEEYCLLFGLYRLLINEAGKRSRAYRGYLLDAANEPLSDAKLAKMFKIHAKKMTRLLRRLESVELLERVDVPKWDLSLDDLPAKKTDSEKDAGAQQDKKRGSRAKNKGNSDRGRRRSAPDGDGAQRFKKTNNDNGNDNNNHNKQTATSGLTASAGCKENNNGRNLEGEPLQDKGIEQECRTHRGRTTTSPTSTPPLPAEPSEPQGSDAGGSAEMAVELPSNSQGSDEGGSAKVIPFSEPPGSADYSRHGLTYGRRVYLALGYAWNMESPEAAREITSFASKHDQVCRILSGLSPPVVDALLARGLREAGKIAKRRSNRNKGAVWNSLMDKFAYAKQKNAKSGCG